MSIVKYFSRNLLKFFGLLLGLLFLNFFLFIFILYTDPLDSVVKNTPQNIYYNLKTEINDSSDFSIKSKNLLKANNTWAMVLQSNGEIFKSYNLPETLNKKYTLTDVVKFTRWYLDDYPVFSFIEDDKVLVLGFPRGSYDKFPSNYYNYFSFKYIFLGFIGIILIDLIAIFIMFFYSKKKLLNEITPITDSLRNLSENKSIELEERGNLLEIKEALNKTSEIIERNKIESERWIRGVSHDIRTPLTVILGTSQALNNKYDDDKFEIIEDNVLLIQDILSNLNLTYSLNLKDEVERETFYLDVLLRKVIVDIMNVYEGYSFKLNVGKDSYSYFGNKTLLERLFRNLILNSVKHNDKCDVEVTLNKLKTAFSITVEDNGSIDEKTVEKLQNKVAYDSDGFGILIAKKIVSIHGGKINFSYNNPGLKITIELPN
ncbi:sensor histidine kinase [Anaerosphaera multitolerans]|uniref:histidine kinase n=1 Tax=Anaerosphaera multitolerans TaxID=2487351 RepID=A0A437S8X8_9FIRM|nr:HAMP domain-containing sensor histidine kinase [Anaerosphaera multitolerans]RVU55553.1 sensor histidine kinase [Anaerosphaera multitolerans]